jgi:hypothetical protein
MAYPAYPTYPPQPPPRRNTAVPWLVGAAVVVVAALVVTLVLTLGGDDDEPSGGSQAGTGRSTDSPTDGYDLGSPETAAQSFAAAAKSADADTVLKLTCLGNAGCVSQHVRDASPSQIDNAKDKIRKGAQTYGEQLDGAQFGKPRKGSAPSTMEVPYTRPGTDDQAFMIFIEWDGKWLWYGSGGGGPSNGGGANAPTTTP